MKPGIKWRWKVTDPGATERLGLLYEPGNWGDLLKAAWALRALELLASLRPGTPIRCLDPFAGRPVYPLTRAAASRSGALVEAGLEGLLELLDEDCRRGHFPSTATLLLRRAARDAIPIRLAVFDTGPSARVLWSALDGAEFLPLQSGYRALSPTLAPPADLVVVDPYDLFDRWRDILPDAVSRARDGLVLLYLYNKAPRGKAYLRTYQGFRRALSGQLERRDRVTAAIIGRVPADAILPRAYHEVVLLGPRVEIAKVSTTLVRLTETLAWTIARPGAIEGPLAGGSAGQDRAPVT